MAKLKFILLACLLIFSRGCDFYSTSLWFFQEGGIEAERNPLTYFFGVGWNGLIIANVIVVGIIIGCLYYFYFHFKRPVNAMFRASNYKELASLHYFNRPDRLYQLLYKVPKNRYVVIAHLGYILTLAGIILSFIATFHNLSQFYDFTFYDRFRELVGRPLFVIYASIPVVTLIVSWTLYKSEYRKYVKTQGSR